MTGSATRVSDNRLVWYTVYGSNLLRRRFDCYVIGGKPEGSTKEYQGCRDKTPLRDDRHMALDHGLYFADHSNSWNGSVAFIRRAASDAHTYARMYLISYGQFNDVVRQENGRNVPGDIVVPPYEDLARANHWQITGFRLYGCFIKIGALDGHPILTLTATHDDLVVDAPSEAYVKTIVSGLEETYLCMSKSEILDYLGGAEGIHGVIQDDVLAGWIIGR